MSSNTSRPSTTTTRRRSRRSTPRRSTTTTTSFASSPMSAAAIVNDDDDNVENKDNRIYIIDDDEQGDDGCKHYKRKCKFYTPCCSKTYQCRFCHDTNEDHVLRGDDVTKVVCSSCGHKQGVKQNCENCLAVFGQYFCYECKLFDDEDKAQFHCDGCGICRIGGRANFFHCQTCNMCLPTHLDGRHKCIENLSRANCPICQEDIHTSREPSQIPPCHHLIHKSCFDQLVRSGHYFCPVCAQSLTDMAEMWKLYDQNIADTPMPKLYQDLYAQIYCRDCLKTSRSSFHVLGIKCKHCQGYNTVRERGPLLRRSGDDFCEADLTEDDVVRRNNSSVGDQEPSAALAENSRTTTTTEMHDATTTSPTTTAATIVDTDALSPGSPINEASGTSDEDVIMQVQVSSVQEWDDLSTSTISDNENGEKN